MLGAIRYQPNRAVLHTDARLLPQRRAAWAAWNYERAGDDGRERAGVCLHYLLNLLQPMPWAQPVIVSLNPVREIHPASIIGEYEYEPSGVRPGRHRRAAAPAARDPRSAASLVLRRLDAATASMKTGSSPGLAVARRCQQQLPTAARMSLCRSAPRPPRVGSTRRRAPDRLRPGAPHPAAAAQHRAFSYDTWFLTAAHAHAARAARAAVRARTAARLDQLPRRRPRRRPRPEQALAWLDDLLQRRRHRRRHGEVWLQTYPRVLGYTFKPVSFWYCAPRRRQRCAPSSPRSTTPSASATATCSTRPAVGRELQRRQGLPCLAVLPCRGRLPLPLPAHRGRAQPLVPHRP